MFGYFGLLIGVAACSFVAGAVYGRGLEQKAVSKIVAEYDGTVAHAVSLIAQVRMRLNSIL